MNALNRFERTFGWMAIGHLPIYVVTAQSILYLWTMLNPEAAHMLVLDPVAVQNGEYWRLLTFLFIVPTQNVIFAFFYLYFQYICGVALEEEWGSFHLTTFYGLGAIGSLIGAYLVGGSSAGAFYLNETIFLAFAALYPNFSILLFFILPIKIKWIALFTWVRILLGLYGSPTLWKLAIFISLANYFIFFSKKHFEQVRDWIQNMRHRRRFKDFQN